MAKAKANLNKTIKANASLPTENADNKTIESLSSQVKLLQEKKVDWDTRTCAKKSSKALATIVKLLNAKATSLDLAKKEVEGTLEVVKLAIKEQYVANFQKVTQQAVLLAPMLTFPLLTWRKIFNGAFIF